MGRSRRSLAVTTCAHQSLRKCAFIDTFRTLRSVPRDHTQTLNTTLTTTLNPLKSLKPDIPSSVDTYPAKARKLAALAAGIRSTSTQVKTWRVSSSRSTTA